MNKQKLPITSGYSPQPRSTAKPAPRKPNAEFISGGMDTDKTFRGDASQHVARPSTPYVTRKSSNKSRV